MNGSVKNFKRNVKKLSLSKEMVKSKRKTKSSQKERSTKLSRDKMKKLNTCSSSSSSEESQNNETTLNIAEVKNIYMAGALKRKLHQPADYYTKLLQGERPDLLATANDLKESEYVILDSYLKSKSELKTMDIVVMRSTESNETKVEDRLMVLNKFNEGRFSAIYSVQRMSAPEANVVAKDLMIMKTSLRQSHCATERLTREIEKIKFIYGEKTKPKRILPIIYDSRVLGIPYFLMLPMDVNLEKMKSEMCKKFSPACVFYVAQEILMGIKDLHSRKLVHRDIKPANVVMNPMNNYQWFLIDFGDTVQEGNSSLLLSTPDALTLPFLSLAGHRATREKVAASYAHDLESWYFILCDLVSSLRWRDILEEKNVILEKRDFLLNIADEELPDLIKSICDLIKKGISYPYKEITQLLRQGFTKNKGTNWKPSWVAKSKQNGNVGNCGNSTPSGSIKSNRMRRTKK